MDIEVRVIFASGLTRRRSAGGLSNALHRQALSTHEKIPKEQTIGRGNFSA